MVCPTCNGVTKAGAPCKMKTCKFAPTCRHHTAVQVAPSPIHGQGLFARRRIAANTVVGNYRVGTQELTRAQFLAKYPNGRASHVWAPRDAGPYYDARDLRKSIAGAANTARNPNARINGNGKLQTRQAIPAGREITVAYGSGFRL